MVFRIQRLRDEITERSGMISTNVPGMVAGSLNLQDPVIEDVRILVLGPYITGFISMSHLGGETRGEAKKIKEELPWLSIRRDIDGNIVYEEIAGGDLVDRITTITEELRADYRLNARLRDQLDRGEDVGGPVDDAGDLAGIDPFRGL